MGISNPRNCIVLTSMTRWTCGLDTCTTYQINNWTRTGPARLHAAWVVMATPSHALGQCRSLKWDYETRSIECAPRNMQCKLPNTIMIFDIRNVACETWKSMTSRKYEQTISTLKCELWTLNYEPWNEKCVTHTVRSAMSALKWCHLLRYETTGIWNINMKSGTWPVEYIRTKQN